MTLDNLKYLRDMQEDAVPLNSSVTCAHDAVYDMVLHDNLDDLLEAAENHWRCQWLVNAGQKQYCLEQVEFEDATDGKRLCKKHGEHLQKRFGRNMKIIAP
jgi:hypothetical protein